MCKGCKQVVGHILVSFVVPGGEITKVVLGNRYLVNQLGTSVKLTVKALGIMEVVTV